MNQRERGFLLLTSRLGNPERPALTPPQLRTLARRAELLPQDQTGRDLGEGDLTALGYDRDMARRIVALLSQEEALDQYLRRGADRGCVPVTRVSPAYPLLLRQRLGLDSPGCLWARGDLALLNTPAIALVGSRELREPNRAFAAALGRRAAQLGLTLISGNARGADRAAQYACLESGGSVISVVADELDRHGPRHNVLYLSEEDYDQPFSKLRALSRNRCIHALGRMVFVAQADLGKGGTWDGTVKNLRFGWSMVACFADGSESAARLERMGAYLVRERDLSDLDGLLSLEPRLPI